ncbi:luciferin sulfotransferase-like [Teleopsis dalmanni]|uniref:luciferin sulfotransferase-like n=1 Tax=Teleopsis dalmanni TaxID=139649 RepID=UPI0018CD0A4D|nr:luciferin sulfotransferase-like [Teleopsis dalmanni]
MEREKVVPKSYPSNVLNKNWSQRPCYFKKNSEKFLKAVNEMEVRDDDVWLITLPKCGTTWMQELVWLVLNNFDFESAKQEHLELRSRFLEFDEVLYDGEGSIIKYSTEMKSPRLVKSHLPLPLLPSQLWTKRPKVIYVFRNPKDAIVSFYYHLRRYKETSFLNLTDYAQDFINEDMLTHQHFLHVTEFYALREEPWIYYTSYERMKSDLRSVIQDVCQFLNKNITETQMQQMLHHLSFEEMKNNSKTNHIWEAQQLCRIFNKEIEDVSFIRKGKIGGYKDDLTDEDINKIDNWMNNELQSHNVGLDDLLLQK